MIFLLNLNIIHVKGYNMIFSWKKFNDSSNFNTFEQFENDDSQICALNLINPKEILNFISDKEGIIDLIIETHILIKQYFPNAELYLKFVKDSEYEELNSLFTYIINRDGNLEDDEIVYLDLLSDFVDLESSYPDFISFYSISLRAEI